MIRADVVIIGGGPAGAACASRLRQGGAACLILEQSRFPRLKPCAGWITPSVLQGLNLSPADYPHSLITFPALFVSIRGLRFRLPTRQHAIRRVEFDDFLLKRSGAPVHLHKAVHIQPEGGGYTVDGEFFGKYLVGAGGTYCPVYRSLFREADPRPAADRIVALEAEFACKWKDPACRLWFLENHLPGYAWYVPKAGGAVNIGVGGTAKILQARGDRITRHWDLLVQKLARLGLVEANNPQPAAHTYYTRRPGTLVQRGNALLVGDSAGLATSDMGEGIGPALQSGRLAAEAILSGGEYRLNGVPFRSLPGILRGALGRGR